MRTHKQLEIIHNVMLQYYGEEFIVEGRDEPATERRHIFAYVAYKNTEARFKDLAKFLNKREHSTIHNAIKTCRDRMEAYKDFANTVKEIDNMARDAIETDKALGLICQH